MRHACSQSGGFGILSKGCSSQKANKVVENGWWIVAGVCLWPSGPFVANLGGTGSIVPSPSTSLRAGSAKIAQGGAASVWVGQPPCLRAKIGHGHHLPHMWYVCTTMAARDPA